MPQLKPQKVNPNELKRLRQLNLFEDEARQGGFECIAGVDEAGRGPLAGPVVAASCIIPQNLFFPGIDDSKMLSAAKRAALFQQITTNPSVIYGVGIISHEIIDRINILQATIQAMLQAVEKLAITPDMLLVDGLALPSTIPSKKIIRGDSLSQSIAAASIIAKETRDRIMEEHDRTWPEYGFKDHKGYPTKKHREAIAKYGPCLIHRMSFTLLPEEESEILCTKL
jgi:ribonuclease HII